MSWAVAPSHLVNHSSKRVPTQATYSHRYPVSFCLGTAVGVFFGGGASWHGEFPGQGSVVATLGPLTHGAGPGSELPPSAAETPLVPSYHSRDSQLCFNTLQTPTSRPTDFDPPFFFFLLSTRVIFQTNNKRQSLRGPYVFLSFKQVSDSCE